MKRILNIDMSKDGIEEALLTGKTVKATTINFDVRKWAEGYLNCENNCKVEFLSLTDAYNIKLVEDYFYKEIIGVPKHWYSEFSIADCTKKNHMLMIYNEFSEWIDIDLEKQEMEVHTFKETQLVIENLDVYYKILDTFSHFNKDKVIEVLTILSANNILNDEFIYFEPWLHLGNVDYNTIAKLYNALDGNCFDYISSFSTKPKIYEKMLNLINKVNSPILGEEIIRLVYHDNIELFMDSFIDEDVTIEDIKSFLDNPYNCYSSIDNSYKIKHVHNLYYSLDELKEFFIEKYKKIPKLINSIYLLQSKLDKDVLNDFNLKSFKFFKNRNLGLRKYIEMSYAFANKYQELGMCSNKLLNAIASGPLQDRSYVEWILKYGKNYKGIENELNINVNADGLISFMDVKFIDITSNWNNLKIRGSIREVKQEVMINKVHFEVNKVESEYELSLKDLECTLDNVVITEDDVKVTILDPVDPIQVILGYETDCCQHLYGAGETSMRYGLICSKSGFLTITKKGLVLAQSLVWETDNSKGEKVLVLDNIEKNKNISSSELLPFYKKWVENSPYNHVQLGLNYSKLILGQPVESNEMYKMNIDDIDFDVYSDAFEKRNWLKKDGVMVC